MFIPNQSNTSGNQYHKLLLKIFWDEFGGNKNNGSKYKEEDKLNALKVIANCRVIYKNQQTLKKRRAAFVSKFGGKKCFICQEPPQCRHHMIQLQHGGINQRKNIVKLCNPCHKKIHPWMN